MKGAVFIGDTRTTLATVAAQLVAMGATETPGQQLQLQHEAGVLFNVFMDPLAVANLPWRDGMRESDSAAWVAESEDAIAWWIECRSEAAFAELIRQAVSDVHGRAWVLDGNDVLWPADDIDPGRLAL